MKPKASPASPLNFGRYEVGPNKRLTRRGKFLCEMERIVPWGKLHAVIAPKYPTSGRVGRQPIGLDCMLREKVKTQICARVEHSYHVVKNLFGYKKTRYKGLAKNEAQLYSLFAHANLVLAKARLLALPVAGQRAS